MIHETIDLYAYFHLPREGKTGGRLTVYARGAFGEMPGRQRPAMLVIPGGGYFMVSDRENEPVALRFLSEGYSVFCLTYTVQTPYPTPLLEGAMAMAYIRENAKKYAVDSAHVAAIGFSAGGHLAGMLATLYADKEITRVLGTRNVRPDAVVLSYAVMTTGIKTHGGTADTISGGDPALREHLSLEKCVTKDSPPAFIWHTGSDGAVPVENALMAAQAYRSAGVPFELHIFEEGVHGLSVADIETAGGGENDALVNVPVQSWLPLLFTWLKSRGFAVKIKA